MTSGRLRKPTELHKLQGTYRKSEHGSRNEPEVAAATTALPRWAGLNGESEKCYRRLAPMLSSMRVLTEADVGALVQLARRYGEYMAAAAIVDAEGMTYETSGQSGYQLKPRPEVAIRDRAWADFQRGLVEFGLTPASRSRIAAPLKDETSPLSGMLSARSG